MEWLNIRESVQQFLFDDNPVKIAVVSCVFCSALWFVLYVLWNLTGDSARRMDRIDKILKFAEEKIDKLERKKC